MVQANVIFSHIVLAEALSIAWEDWRTFLMASCEDVGFQTVCFAICICCIRTATVRTQIGLTHRVERTKASHTITQTFHDLTRSDGVEGKEEWDIDQIDVLHF